MKDWMKERMEFSERFRANQMKEVKMHTTIYWEVPEGQDPEAYISFLRESLTKREALKLATDYGDSEFEVNE
jgi:hypothetical protein